ncbi:glutamine-hydrolyzing GMP synthase subunit GuaA [candidate division WOR-3 bacterium]|uniref:GMP synthase (glutamine-hydrolyzing) n=1 Tax=candidate division WOR-3 bacterium TaxID=2052148 RepID=A0A9D5KBI5_UNCW3|nr:glutamine-hydrolyzing GMP synthase subunit GuaA [candidate division WOR-3 bacterium]MBD3365119.1 glutamine-hydrolyzing GMP synthase subunit GuaA [candidate division WOR-3 bacterium]
MKDVAGFVNQSIEKLMKDIEGTAIIACSGGVDSTTAAALVNTAIGERLVTVFVDTGYLRKGESERVQELLKGMGLNLHFVDASDEFYKALRGVTDPERKRKIIGGMFIKVFEREAEKVDADTLIQGTIAPDWIESGGQLRDVIKSHHNVGGLPEEMKMRLVEPLRDLYKDEVRKVARHLGLEIAERQPFPGPGLAVRVLGEATRERTTVLREACAIVEEEIEQAAERGDCEIPWQYFAVLLPVKSVGVRGDVRSYGETIVVRAVGSLDGMTASASPIPHPVLERIGIRITNTTPEVVRVVYDVTHKPPGTIEWE